MKASTFQIHTLGIFGLLAGLVGGACIGFKFSGGGFESIGGSAELFGIFLTLAPLMFLSPVAMFQADSQNLEIWPIITVVGIVVTASSWIVSSKSGLRRFQVGTFLGAAIWNYNTGVFAAQALLA